MPIKKTTKTHQQSLTAAFKSTPSRITKSAASAGVKNAKSVLHSEAPATKQIHIQPTEEEEEDADKAVEQLKQPEPAPQGGSKDQEHETVEVPAEGEEDDELAPAVIKIQRDTYLSEELSQDVQERVSKVSHRQVKSYADNIQNSRMTRPVHQEGLTQGEKILRHFDLSSQYGPCIGITRLKRWIRANKLNLNPPIEVLAVLVDADMARSAKDEDVLGCMAHIHDLLVTKLQEN